MISTYRMNLPWTKCASCAGPPTADFLQQHQNVRLHFTPWLNQIELWFARIERDVIACGIFSSVKDLALKLMRYIHAYWAAPKPFSWKYSNVSRRIHT
jgi:hypothetical protein